MVTLLCGWGWVEKGSKLLGVTDQIICFVIFLSGKPHSVVLIKFGYPKYNVICFLP